ncbi:hypothetical protein SSBG_04658 [Streptomyces sp. SPB074]|nr:hypothetical protein SSBG_04658 [Streptomyces sp. SPB074]
MPPEFFLDRNPGRRVAEGLRAHGWIVHSGGRRAGRESRA